MAAVVRPGLRGFERKLQVISSGNSAQWSPETVPSGPMSSTNCIHSLHTYTPLQKVKLFYTCFRHSNIYLFNNNVFGICLNKNILMEFRVLEYIYFFLNSDSEKKILKS